MKKLIMLSVLIIIGLFSPIAYACTEDCVSHIHDGNNQQIDVPEVLLNGSFIVSESLDDLPKPILSDSGKLSKKRMFFKENPNTTRTICYMCGNPGLGLGVVKQEWDTRIINCPAVSTLGWGDVLVEYRHYNAEKCTYCGHNVLLDFIRTTWEVTCNAEGGSGGTWEIIPGATVSQGYDPHQCIVP